ncbi:MAG: hypothetical protein U0667_06835 [Chloroflexota bacterium]
MAAPPPPRTRSRSAVTTSRAWMEAALPTLQRVLGSERVVEMPPVGL